MKDESEEPSPRPSPTSGDGVSAEEGFCALAGEGAGEVARETVPFRPSTVIMSPSWRGEQVSGGEADVEGVEEFFEREEEDVVTDLQAAADLQREVAEEIVALHEVIFAVLAEGHVAAGEGEFFVELSLVEWIELGEQLA